MPSNAASQGLAIPLARWAERRLRNFERETRSPDLTTLRGATLVGERAALGGFKVPGKVSAGPGTSRLHKTRDNRWFALTIPRPADRDYLPALFGDEALDPWDDDAISNAVARNDCEHLLDVGRALGLPVAAVDQETTTPAISVLQSGPPRHREPGSKPLVIDLSAIWAGPLIGNLLWLAGAQVIKVESKSRPDEMRAIDSGLFERVNQGKDNIVVDFSSEAEKAALNDLIRRADFVIESSRVRALRQLGIHADALVREVPGLVWLTVTGHGATGEQANWAGIGHDCSVAGGLTRALAEVTGEVGYVGDAIADPLTGILAALEGWRAWKAGSACRLGFALGGVVSLAIAEERKHDAAQLEQELRDWGRAIGQPFPAIPMREASEEVRAVGADTATWLAC
ncbi:MAG: CoA transferase [Novosphingobium sp.]|nr:CoA transferase [Novosphingobium sp.]